MGNYSSLAKLADDHQIVILEKNFKSNAKGLCVGNRIGLRKGLAYRERTCILAEELGHYFTTTGNILDVSKTENRKQEKLARKWAVKYLMQPSDLIAACVDGCNNLCSVAEYLDVTIEFLLETIEVFKYIYGPEYISDSYTIVFNDIGYSVYPKEDFEQ